MASITSPAGAAKAMVLPCPAMYAPVSDSGQAVVHLVYGGDWGIRLKPENLNEDWDINSPNQNGEPYIMLIDGSDIILDG